MKEQYCGKTGRQARGAVRALLMGKEPSVPASGAVDHVSDCMLCRDRIQRAIENNPNTVYKGTVGESISAARNAISSIRRRSLRYW